MARTADPYSEQNLCKLLVLHFLSISKTVKCKSLSIKCIIKSLEIVNLLNMLKQNLWHILFIVILKNFKN